MDLDEDVPNEFLCPITLDIMKEPMVMPDGHTYEKEAIRIALEKTHCSPLTKMPMEFSDGVINYSLKSLIDDFVMERQIKLKDNNEKINNLKFEEEEQIKIEFEELSARFISKEKSANLCNDSIHVWMKPKKVKTSPPICLICVVDISGSMNSNCAKNVQNMESMYISRLELLKHSLKTIISSLRKEDMICVITFNSDAEVLIKPTVLFNEHVKSNVLSNLNNMHPDGATNIWAGIKMAIDTSSTIKSKNIQKSIMVFTDGESNTNPPKGVYDTLKETLKVNDDAFTISTFSYGDEVGSELLIDIANLGNGIYGYCPDATMVGTIFINYMANILSTITPLVKVVVTQGDSIKKTMTIGPLYRGFRRNAIFKVDKNLLNETKVTVELPLNNEKFDVPLNIESVDIQKYIDEMSTVEDSNENKGNEDDDDDEMLDEESDEEETIGKLEDIDTNVEIPEKDLDPIKYEEILLNQIARNKFIIMLNKLINFKIQSYDLTENGNAAMILDAYLDIIKSLKYKTKFIKDLIVDISNPDPNHGQVEKAIEVKYYKSWGKSYLSSLLRFHQYEQCGNFKDQSLQYYSHEVFSAYRKMANTLFINLPPPEIRKSSPRQHRFNHRSIRYRPPIMGSSGIGGIIVNPYNLGIRRSNSPNSYNNSYMPILGRNENSSLRSSRLSSGFSAYKSGGNLIAMSEPNDDMNMNMDDNNDDNDVIDASKLMHNFLNRHGGCFNGEAVVLLANSQTKLVKDLKKGDLLNNGAVVHCLIEQHCGNKLSKPYMCDIDGVLLTPYHPISIHSKWCFPCDQVQPKPVTINSWYNLILNDEDNKKYEVEFQNGIKAITLGHYRTENDILKHPYFGTDAVLKDLEERDPNGYKKGYIFIKEFNSRQLQFDENQYCINYYKIQTQNNNNEEIIKINNNNYELKC